jgi:tricorn protease
VNTAAYLRHPTIAGEVVAFVAEDDLWTVEATGGTAHRITANPGSITRPRLSPDGTMIAYVSRDEGVRDAWLMAVDGSAVRRLTFFGSVISIAAWAPDGTAVIVVSDHDQPFAGFTHLWSVPVDGGPPERLPVGHAWSLSFLSSGGMVLGRNAFDPARWKRYRGGRAGQIWADRTGSGEFEPLVDLAGNLADPMAVGPRILFLSDHEGVGNLYSVTPTGRNIRRHTHHDFFYVRYPSSDGRRVVYHAGGDLYLLDPAGDGAERIDVTIPSARSQRNRRFHPEGHSVAMDVRGSAFTMPLWEGSPIRHSGGSADRDRLTSWLPDGERIVSITDQAGEERLIVRSVEGSKPAVLLDIELGRVRSLDVAPKSAGSPSRVAATNHRHELSIVDLDTGTSELIHRSPYMWIGGTAWSPDGRWLAFCSRRTETTQDLFCYDTRESKLHAIGTGAFVDQRPSFDPDLPLISGLRPGPGLGLPRLRLPFFGDRDDRAAPGRHVGAISAGHERTPCPGRQRARSEVCERQER